MTALRCEELRKSFGGVFALDDVKLSFPSSGVIAIIGPNGAGKTTLFNVLSGFLRPDSGRWFLNELEISAFAPNRIVSLGLVRTFQEMRLVRRLSAIENVLLARPKQRGEHFFGALFRIGIATQERLNREHALNLLQFVKLESMARNSAGELSYGQQKLLTIACALATEPKVLLLDEPVAGVHPELIETILGYLLALKDQGKLVVLIEHNIDAVRRVADSVIVMDQGSVIAQGPPKDVLDRPQIVKAYVE